MIRKRRRRQEKSLLCVVSIQDPAVDFDALEKSGRIAEYLKTPWDFKDLPLKPGKTPTQFFFRLFESDDLDEIDNRATRAVDLDVSAQKQENQRRRRKRLAAFDLGLVRVVHWDEKTPEIDLTKEPERLEEIREALYAEHRDELGMYFLAASTQVEDTEGKSPSPESSSAPES